MIWCTYVGKTACMLEPCATPENCDRRRSWVKKVTIDVLRQRACTVCAEFACACLCSEMFALMQCSVLVISMHASVYGTCKEPALLEVC